MYLDIALSAYMVLWFLASTVWIRVMMEEDSFNWTMKNLFKVSILGVIFGVAWPISVLRILSSEVLR